MKNTRVLKKGFSLPTLLRKYNPSLPPLFFFFFVFFLLLSHNNFLFLLLYKLFVHILIIIIIIKKVGGMDKMERLLLTEIKKKQNDSGPSKGIYIILCSLLCLFLIFVFFFTSPIPLN